RGGALVGREERQRRRGQRAAERKIVRVGDEDEDEATASRNRAIRNRNRARQMAAQRESRGPVILETPVTVRSLSETAGIRANELQRRLVSMGIMVTINATLSEEQVELLAMEMDIPIQLKRPETAETRMEASLLAGTEDDAADLVPRPPVVTFMGH